MPSLLQTNPSDNTGIALASELCTDAKSFAFSAELGPEAKDVD